MTVRLGHWRLRQKAPQFLADERGTVFWAVLAVLLVASLLFSSVVLYGGWHQSQNRLLLSRMQARYLAEAALAQAQSHLAELDASELTETIVISDSLPDRQRWTATISPWGCYLRAVCTGSSHRASHTVDALLGRSPAGPFDYAVRLFGAPYPLVVAGQTRITGGVSVGPGGVMEGQYQGRGLTDTVLVHGDIVVDPPPQPIPLDWLTWSVFTEHLDKLRGDSPVHTDRTLIIDDDWQLSRSDSVIVIDAEVVFERSRGLDGEHSVALFASGPISISKRTAIDGRWAICSDRMITVEDSADISGVVLWAPRIEVKDYARFSGQAIADTMLEVNGQAATTFPTVLWAGGSSTELDGNPRLNLKSTKWCEGIAGISSTFGPWGWAFGEDESGELSLAAHSGWRGYLYVNGKAAIQGIVAGSVNAELLVVEDPPTTYLNWLLDARVSRPAWPGSTPLPALLNSNAEWQIAEYLPLSERNRDLVLPSLDEL